MKGLLFGIKPLDGVSFAAPFVMLVPIDDSGVQKNRGVSAESSSVSRRRLTAAFRARSRRTSPPPRGADAARHA
jgi:hypothetical protein